MQKNVLMLVLTLWLCPVLVLAQSGPATTDDPAPNTPEWQLTLDVVKNKAKSLMEKNAMLVEEHNSLVTEYQNVQNEIKDTQLKNEALRQELKQRHGRSLEQMHIDDLNAQLKAKEGEIKSLQKELVDIQNETVYIQRKTGLKKLKMLNLEKSLKEKANSDNAVQVITQRTNLENDGELKQLSERVDQEQEKEEALRRQLEDVKKTATAPEVSAPVDPSQIKALEVKVDLLRKQKEGLQNQSNIDNSQTNKAQRFSELMAKKKDLEHKIREFEEQLNVLKDPQARGFLNPKEQNQVIRQMADLDNRNTQLRRKVSNLREDVNLLRDQVNHLERKVSVTQQPAQN